MKKCTSCNEDKPVQHFHKSSKSKDGLQSQCKVCRNKKSSEYFSSNKEKCIESSKRWTKANKNRVNELKKIRRLKNKGTDKQEKQKTYSKDEIKRRYRKNMLNESWLKNRRIKRAVYEKKRRLNLLKRIENQIRCRTALALIGKVKLHKYQEYIGCSTEQLKSYLESKFQPGMGWHNWGRDGWHIDHIIPISSFDLNDTDQFKKAFHYTNLQPLWAEDNLKKGAKII